MVDCGVAQFMLPEQGESGDRHLISTHQKGVLIAVIDGIGHGKEAAKAAKTAVSILKERASKPLVSLVECCHEKLRGMRGVVLSLASIDASDGVMTWLGVGNVQGVLMRADGNQTNAPEPLLLRAGVVGCPLPPLQATVLPIARGDTLYFATDGVSSAFSETLTALENPQKAADRILRQFQSGKDDALVVVARLVAAHP
jgi:phosphoserine phosphatase RsbX